MNVKQPSAAGKHRMEIAEQIHFAQQNLPFFGSIRLRSENSVDVLQNSLSGLFKSIALNGITVETTVENGNAKIGQQAFTIPVQDIAEINVDRDINGEVVHKSERSDQVGG